MCCRLLTALRQVSGLATCLISARAASFRPDDRAAVAVDFGDVAEGGYATCVSLGVTAPVKPASAVTRPAGTVTRVIRTSRCGQIARCRRGRATCTHPPRNETKALSSERSLNRLVTIAQPWSRVGQRICAQSPVWGHIGRKSGTYARRQPLSASAVVTLPLPLAASGAATPVARRKRQPRRGGPNRGASAMRCIEAEQLGPGFDGALGLRSLAQAFGCPPESGSTHECA
jgi:hypothetical protein